MYEKKRKNIFRTVDSEVSSIGGNSVLVFYVFTNTNFFSDARLPEDKSALCVHEIKLVIQPCPRLTYCCSVGQRTYCSLHLGDKRYFYLFISIICCFSLFPFSIQLSIIYLLSLFFLCLTLFLLCVLFSLLCTFLY